MQKGIACTLIIYILFTLHLSRYLPIVPDKYADTPVFIAASLITASLIMWLLYIRKSPAENAKKPLAAKVVILSLLITLPGSTMIGWCMSRVYFVNAGLLTGIIYPAKSISAKCMSSRDGYRSGNISSFTLQNGESWKVYGLKKVCPDKPKDCTLTLTSGLYAHKIHTVTCQGS